MSTVWLEIFEDLNFRDLIFEDRNAVLAPPTSTLTTPIAQQSGNLPDCSSHAHAVLCCPPADFGLQFRRELGVSLSPSPTLSALLAFQHTLQFLVGRYDRRRSY